jgi:hypothetical protein
VDEVVTLHLLRFMISYFFSVSFLVCLKIKLEGCTSIVFPVMRITMCYRAVFMLTDVSKIGLYEYGTIYTRPRHAKLVTDIFKVLHSVNFRALFIF